MGRRCSQERRGLPIPRVKSEATLVGNPTEHCRPARASQTRSPLVLRTGSLSGSRGQGAGDTEHTRDPEPRVTGDWGHGTNNRITVFSAILY